MLALADVRAREEAARCHLCGLPKSVCRDQSMEKQVKAEAERCHVATAVVRARAGYERDGMPDMSGIDVIPMMPDPAADLLPETSPPASSSTRRR